MRILFKYPSRGRPLLFFKTLQRYLYLMSGRHDCDFLISMDTDDTTMNTELVRDFICQLGGSYPRAKVTYYYDDHDGIVHAVNNRIRDCEFDVVMAISDDFIPERPNYDDIIFKTMLESWPEYDGAIYFNDGSCGERFALAPILGRKLYIEQGYFFDPFYKWGEADRALTVELRAKNKITYFPEILFSHHGEHHDKDEVYNRTRKMRLKDHQNFKQRVREGYYAT